MKQATVISTNLDVFAESPLPLDWLMLSTCVYGVSGAGKSTFSRRVAEQVHAVGERFCTVDWKGDWSGLRTSADGAGEGLPVVIFGGKQGDFPLEKEAGASLGAAVAARPQSTILDLSRMNLTDRPFFLARFFEALFHHNSEPLFLINDECHNYVPQVGRSGRGDDDDVRRCLNAAITIAKEGRGRALGRMYVTQRAPGLHTDVREIAEALVAFRSTGKNDKVRVREWLEDSFDGDELVAAVRSLPSLEDGECLFASSNKLIRQCGTRRALMPTTFDSSRTPRLGERRREPVKRSAPDLAAFRKALGEELEKQKSEDPELLRQQVKSLTAERDELAARLDGAVAPGPPERIEIPVETPALVDWKKLAAHFERVADIEIERLRTAICNVIVDGEVMFSGTHVPRVFEDSPRPSPLPVSVQPHGETLKEKAAGVGHRDVKPAKTRTRQPATATTAPEGWTMEEETLYQKIKARLIEEAPALVRLLAVGSELEVTIERKIVQLDTSSMKGRIAALIAGGFLDSGKRNGEIVKELGRTGPSANTGRVSEALSDLVAMGIVTREGERYCKAPGAKVRKTEIASS